MHSVVEENTEKKIERIRITDVFEVFSVNKQDNHIKHQRICVCK